MVIAQKQTRRQRAYPAELRERALELYLSGQSYRGVAEALAISLSTVAKWAKQERWQVRRKRALADKAAKIAEDARHRAARHRLVRVTEVAPDGRIASVYSRLEGCLE